MIKKYCETRPVECPKNCNRIDCKLKNEKDEGKNKGIKSPN